MTKTVIHKYSAPLKRYFPEWLWRPLRMLGTAILGPIRFAHHSGYWRSAFARSAVSRTNQPIPWYTYPAIDFLKFRNFEEKVILEFGGGQSTLWWAERAKAVVTLEGDKSWYEKISGTMPSNVDLNYVSMCSKDENVAHVNETLGLKEHEKYDVIIIDGLYRFEMIEIALKRVKDDGIIICDNAEGYGFAEGFRNSGLLRVDFFGNAPGVILPHATCLYFSVGADIFDASHPIPVIAHTH